MNTYMKYCPNVFVAKCEEKHNKGDVIVLTTKYGKENECIVYNFLGTTKDNFYCYSIVRADGFNNKVRAEKKAEKYQDWSEKAAEKSDSAYSKVSQEMEFLSLGEPIKVGHHSEKKHRAALDRVDNAMRKTVELDKKSKEHAEKVKYWEGRKHDVNLSMPECIEFYKIDLDKKIEIHEILKKNPEKRSHSYSLQYALKDKKEAQKNYDLAVKLWG